MAGMSGTISRKMAFQNSMSKLITGNVRNRKNIGIREENEMTEIILRYPIYLERDMNITVISPTRNVRSCISY